MATEITKKDTKLSLDIEIEHLSLKQIRLIRTINSSLSQLLATKDEVNFFEKSADLMRLCAAVIKQSNFTENLVEQNNIPYAEQALEYSVEILQEHMTQSNVVRYDN